MSIQLPSQLSLFLPPKTVTPTFTIFPNEYFYPPLFRHLKPIHWEILIALLHRRRFENEFSVCSIRTLSRDLNRMGLGQISKSIHHLEHLLCLDVRRDPGRTARSYFLDPRSGDPIHFHYRSRSLDDLSSSIRCNERQRTLEFLLDFQPRTKG